MSYGTWNTRLFDVDYDAGKFGPDGAMRFQLERARTEFRRLPDLQLPETRRGLGEVPVRRLPKTLITAFASIIDLKSNTPNTKGPTRAQVAQFGPNYLMSDKPTDANYYGYNFYHVPTDFDYVSLRTTWGGGWSLETRPTRTSTTTSRTTTAQRPPRPAPPTS